MNLAAIGQKALQKGLIRDLNNISDSDLVKNIFHSGFSTKASVTAISGRGVGMDVVENSISKLGGKIEVIWDGERDQNQQRRFHFNIELPLSSFDTAQV
jgi:chemotaxis protein histidine kinase CheA